MEEQPVSKVTGDLTTLGTGRKPVVPNITFKSTVDAVKEGRIHCGYLLMENFELDMAQTGLLLYHIDLQKRKQGGEEKKD